MRENFAEKRRYPRLDLRNPMRYRRLEASSSGFKGSLIRNISEGGARMTIYEFLPRNLKLAIEIPLLTEAESVKGTCRVAWARKAAFSEQYDVGIEFDSLGCEDAGRIAKFVVFKTANESRMGADN